MISKKVDLTKLAESYKGHSCTYSTRYFRESTPKYEIPEKGMPADAAYQLVADELNLDGKTAFDLGSFTATWMEPEAEKLIMENLGKNFIDQFEYPQTTEIHNRVVNMLARLFNAPEDSTFCGTATIGSSEAIELGLLAHKWTWKKRRENASKASDKPNIIFGAGAHVCWDKFAKYFDVAPRVIPMEVDRFNINVEKVAAWIDENTICVGAILGTTYTGAIDPVADLNDLLEKVKRAKGWDIPIHVDAASGGFIAPFVNPHLEWDFRLPQVKSINVSGHKFGLVYPGLGWLIFRDQSDLPEDLIFQVNYLGDERPTYTLNFSRGSGMILAQYYNLLRLGREGYEMVMRNCMTNARYFSHCLVDSEKFELLSHSDLPIVAFKLKPDVSFTAVELAQKLRERGWMLPAYPLPENADSINAMRVVVRETFSRDMADLLLEDLVEAYKKLEGTPGDQKVTAKSSNRRLVYS